MVHLYRCCSKLRRPARRVDRRWTVPSASLPSASPDNTARWLAGAGIVVGGLAVALALVCGDGHETGGVRDRDVIHTPYPNPVLFYDTASY